tara:strand:- start:54 stop:485 length:432 start_codon:yes stop_codon:yes gene_type:complete
MSGIGSTTYTAPSSTPTTPSVNKRDYAQAIVELRPGAEWSYVGGELIWQDESQTRPTDDEINTKYNEWNTSKYPMKLLRDERDRLIAESDWRVIKAKETSTNIPTAWKTYRQALRDLPSTQTPVLDSNSPVGISSVTWPTPPS